MLVNKDFLTWLAAVVLANQMFTALMYEAIREKKYVYSWQYCNCWYSSWSGYSVMDILHIISALW